jgi:hypothetical protein
MGKRRFVVHTAAVGCAIGMASGCRTAGGGGGSATTRDSAGIAIVENSGPAWASSAGWKVVDTPLVDIGGKSGDAASDVDRVSGPVVMSDGRLAIANAGTNEIRIYDAKGAHLRTSGRAGSGPGEFQNIAGIWLGPGDSLLVSDILVRRLTVLDRDGNVGRSLSLGGASGQMLPVNGKIDFAIPSGWFADGSVVGVSQSFSLTQKRDGIYRDSVTMLRYGPDGTIRDTLGRFPGVEMEQMILSFNGQSFPAPTPVPLGRQSNSLVHGDRLYLAQNNAWEIEVRGLDGTLRSLIRAKVQSVPITPADADANRKEQLEQIAGQPMMRNVPDALKKQMTDRIEQAKYPAMLPFFGTLLADGVGNLWAQEISRPGDSVQRFAVIDSTGRFLGRVMMPANFRLASVGANAVYGVWKDADDVEHVRVYPLKKG